jgi:hypothetical protein
MIFSSEKLPDGETGLIEFQYSTYPCVGDELTVRTSPGNKVLTFRCIGRRFDFSGAEESVFLLFDVCE